MVAGFYDYDNRDRWFEAVHTYFSNVARSGTLSAIFTKVVLFAMYHLQK